VTLQRCPAAHPQDPTPCSGPIAVTVLDRANHGARGCEHHGARLLASLDGGRVYGLPDAPDGAAIRVLKAAADIPPFVWLTAPTATVPPQSAPGGYECAHCGTTLPGEHGCPGCGGLGEYPSWSAITCTQCDGKGNVPDCQAGAAT
jgi:hypothetical protein